MNPIDSAVLKSIRDTNQQLDKTKLLNNMEKIDKLSCLTESIDK